MDWTAILVAAIPVIGSVVTVILTTMTRKTAEKTQKTAMQTQADMKATTNAVTDLMRNEITKLYYKRQDVGQLYEHERQSLDKMYRGYHAAGGNSFVDDIYREMRTWKVIGSGKKIVEGKE